MRINLQQEILQVFICISAFLKTTVSVHRKYALIFLLKGLGHIHSCFIQFIIACTDTTDYHILPDLIVRSFQKDGHGVPHRDFSAVFLYKTLIHHDFSVCLGPSALQQLIEIPGGRLLVCKKNPIFVPCGRGRLIMSHIQHNGNLVKIPSVPQFLKPVVGNIHIDSFCLRPDQHLLGTSHRCLDGHNRRKG